MDLSSLVKNKIVKNIFRIIVIWIIVAVARNFVEEKVENILTILGFIFTILIILGLASYWFWKKYK
jgi:ethanolamine transporter EutH